MNNTQDKYQLPQDNEPSFNNGHDHKKSVSFELDATFRQIKELYNEINEKYDDNQRPKESVIQEFFELCLLNKPEIPPKMGDGDILAF